MLTLHLLTYCTVNKNKVHCPEAQQSLHDALRLRDKIKTFLEPRDTVTSFVNKQKPPADIKSRDLSHFTENKKKSNKKSLQSKVKERDVTTKVKTTSRDAGITTEETGITTEEAVYRKFVENDVMEFGKFLNRAIQGEEFERRRHMLLVATMQVKIEIK